MLHTTVLSEKVNYYMDNLTVQHPDSIIVSVDEILNRTRTAPEIFKFFLIDLLNKYAGSKIVGMDAVYVHIALEYYNKGAAPWTEKDQLDKIIYNAKKLEPILIGKKAPDIEVLTLNGTNSRLYDFEAKSTILFFWDPECNHCKKSVATLVDIEKKLRSKGLRVFTVCTAITPAAVTKTKDFVSSYGMESFHNTVDPYIKSNYKKEYDIQTTPQIFVLDSNKYIRSKRIDADQLEKVIEGLGLLK
jgi:peroxiredoxin